MMLMRMRMMMMMVMMCGFDDDGDDVWVVRGWA